MQIALSELRSRREYLRHYEELGEQDEARLRDPDSASDLQAVVDMLTARWHESDPDGYTAFDRAWTQNRLQYEREHNKALIDQLIQRCILQESDIVSMVNEAIPGFPQRHTRQSMTGALKTFNSQCLEPVTPGTRSLMEDLFRQRVIGNQAAVSSSMLSAEKAGTPSLEKLQQNIALKIFNNLRRELDFDRPVYCNGIFYATINGTIEQVPPWQARGLLERPLPMPDPLADRLAEVGRAHAIATLARTLIGISEDSTAAAIAGVNFEVLAADAARFAEPGAFAAHVKALIDTQGGSVPAPSSVSRQITIIYSPSSRLIQR